MNIFLLVLGVFLTLGTAVFVAAEFSLVALDPASVRRRSDEGEKGLGPVVRALGSLSTQLSGAQVGITLTTILLGYTTQAALTAMLGDAFGAAGLTIALSVTLAAIVAAVLVNAFSMLFGELVPKNMALADPLHTAKLTAPLQLAFTWLFGPLIGVLNGTANGLLRLVGIEPVEELSSARSASELAALVEHSADVGTMEKDTANLFTRSIAMRNLRAVDAMTDRGRVAALDADATVSDLVDLARETGYSRFPIWDEGGHGFDKIAMLRGAAGIPFERRSEVYAGSSSISVPAAEVPETVQLTALLEQLRVGPQMLVVVDEFGEPSGIVTLEDVVEELTGEISDEHDRRRAGIRRVSDREYLVPGTMRPDELYSATGLEVPESTDYETLGGFVMAGLGRIPTVGDRLEDGPVAAEVIAMKGRRVTRLRIQADEAALGEGAPKEAGTTEDGQATR